MFLDTSLEKFGTFTWIHRSLSAAFGARINSSGLPSKQTYRGQAGEMNLLLSAAEEEMQYLLTILMLWFHGTWRRLGREKFKRAS